MQKTMQLPAGHMRQSAEYEYSRYFVRLPPGVTYPEIFNPSFWSHHARLKVYDVVRIVAHDWSFDVEVTVVAKTKGGANVQLHPLIPADPGEMEVKLVPRLRNGKLAVRVDYQKASGWRVIALDGSEHSRDYQTKGEAEVVMHRYVRELGMQFPPAMPSDETEQAA